MTQAVYTHLVNLNLKDFVIMCHILCKKIQNRAVSHMRNTFISSTQHHSEFQIVYSKTFEFYFFLAE
jgi:hypothetical protein